MSGLQLRLDDLMDPDPDAGFVGSVVHDLDGHAWVEHCPGWLTGADSVYAEVAATVPFAAHERRMYDRDVLEPRLTAFWDEADPAFPLPPLIDRARRLLGDRYGIGLDSAGFALYRDGRDSVAWHADRVGRRDPDAFVALVSLGSTRRFLMRRRGGGRSLRFDVAGGDLLVMGRCQRSWEHCVPKTGAVGPRISIGFRHGIR